MKYEKLLEKIAKLEKQYAKIENIVYNYQGEWTDEVYDLAEKLETLSDKISAAHWKIGR